MKAYIGCKMIKAAPAIRKGGKIYLLDEPVPKSMDPVEEGYKVLYPDGYVSFSPKDVFEKSYFELKCEDKISQEDVDRFIACYEDFKLGEKTTAVKSTLMNGFTLVESSSCVDPKNFSQDIGINICLEHINDKVWYLLGFLLQTAKDGVKR
jgi:hypothetical protein